MRISLVASSFLPRQGGVEEHVSSLARELRARGHDVVIWSVDQGDVVPETDGGVPLRYLPSPLPNRSLRGLATWAAAAPRAWRAWRRAFRSDRPEVLVVECFGANGPWAVALARRTGTPLVYANHGETFMDAHGVFEQSALLRRALRTALQTAGSVVSCSAFAAADLARFGAVVDPVVVGNGVDLDLVGDPLPALPARYIAAVGRLVGNKGFDRLLRAYAVAIGDGRLADVGLVIAGSGPADASLRGLADELGVAARVRFLGATSRAGVRTLLDGAVAHVVPSDVEAFGLVVLEGWRSGVPVIVTDRGGPPEFVQDRVDGLLFDPFDTDRLAQLLVSVATDDEFARRLGAAGRDAVRRFTWAAVADRYEVVLAGSTS